MSPSPFADDALHAWTQCLASGKAFDFDWDVNTALVLDNWRTLHGRAGGAMESDDERILERIVVS